VLFSYFSLRRLFKDYALIVLRDNNVTLSFTVENVVVFRSCQYVIGLQFPIRLAKAVNRIGLVLDFDEADYCESRILAFKFAVEDLLVSVEMVELLL
jgi:hypothetical protein